MRRQPRQARLAILVWSVAANFTGWVTFADDAKTSPSAAKSKPADSAAERQPVVGERFVYKMAGNRALRLFVLKPSGWAAADRRPAVVFFHGGGWSGGSPSQFEQHSRHLAARGMVCVNVEYRLLTNKTDPPAVCIQDAKSAMRWVRSRAAELGIAPARIAAGGGSAGGHLAAATAMLTGQDDPQDNRNVSARPDALLLFNPVIDNSRDGYGAARIGERLQEFSPAHNVRRDTPPTILFVGSKDTAIKVPSVERFRDEMTAAGVRCETRIYDGEVHGFFNYRPAGNPFFDKTLLEADAFLVSLGWLPEPASKTVLGQAGDAATPPAKPRSGSLAE